MSKIYEIEDELLARQPRRPAPKADAHLVYLVLITLVLLVAAASVTAWWSTEHSLENRARRGSPMAQYLLGKHLYEQATGPQDYYQAAQWIRKAADQGYVQAQTALGLLYANGLGVPKDYMQAAKWLRRAADQGFALAQNELGVMYAQGHGLNRNLQQAAHWCRLAAAQGSGIALRNSQLAEVAQARIIPSLTTSGNKTYRQVILQNLGPDGVTVSFQPEPGGLGVARLKLESLPQELQELCKCTDKKGVAADSAYSQLAGISTTL